MRDLHDAVSPVAETAGGSSDVGSDGLNPEAASAASLVSAVEAAPGESGTIPASLWDLDGELEPISDSASRPDSEPAEASPGDDPDQPENDHGPLVLVLAVVGGLLFVLAMLAFFSRGTDPTEIVAGANEERDATTTAVDDESGESGTTGDGSDSDSTDDNGSGAGEAQGDALGSGDAEGAPGETGSDAPPTEPDTQTSATQVTRPPGATPPAPAPPPTAPPAAPPVGSADIPGGFAELVTAVADLNVVLGTRFTGAPLYDSIQVFDQFVQADGTTTPIGAGVKAAVAALAAPVGVSFVGAEPAPETEAIWVRVNQPVASGNTFHFGIELRCPVCGGDPLTAVVPVVREADGCWHLEAAWHLAIYGPTPMC